MKQTLKNYGIISLLFSLLVVWLNILFGTLNLVETGAYYMNAWTLFYIILVAPLLEEVIFRLGLFSLLYKVTKNPLLCITISAVLFGLMHMISGVDKSHIVQAAYTTICGFVLGFVFYISGRKINYPFIMHIIANIVSLFIPAFVIENKSVGLTAVAVLIILMMILLNVTIRKKVLEFDKNIEKD